MTFDHPSGGEEREPRLSLLRRSPQARVLALCGALLVTALWLQVAVVRHLDDTPSALRMPWVLLAVAFAATEVFVIHIEFRRGAHTFSLSELPLLIGLFFLDPSELILARMLGSAVALVLHRRQAPQKLIFNLSMFALEAALVVVVFHAVLADQSAVDPRAWLAAFAAMATATLLSTTTVSAAMALDGGRFRLRVALDALATGLVLSVVTNTSLGLVAVLVLLQDVRAAGLLLVVAAVLLLAYTGYTGLRRRYASLELLYDFTKSVGRSLKVEAMAMAILSQARDLLRAERAELLLPGARPEDATRITVDRDGRLVTELAVGDPDGMRRRVLQTGRPLLVNRSTRDERLRDELQAEGMKDVLIAPLPNETGVLGLLIVADRLGDVSTFDSDDLRLFETLANHASVSIENGRLVDRLREEAAEKTHQAWHDSLTGLPNRTLFAERVRLALDGANRSADGVVGVVLIDLDRFKEVNDTLGHHNGDHLLKEVSLRLEGALRRGDTIARLGGDEFAVLLRNIDGEDDARRAADRLRQALDGPFVLSDITLQVTASMGISLYPHHGGDPATLLQRADVAMYEAKAARTGAEVYAEASDQNSPRRLSLLGGLRSAVDADDLVVHYQPKAELASGRFVGVEALVRWRHPDHGLVSPDEFIALAEQSGAIRPLTLFVLRSALFQCAEWRAAGLRLNVAVNLSVRTLLDAGFPDDVRRLLTEAELPGTALTLEITESSMMADPARTVTTLARLHAMGVVLSIDDFGTGYSSLSHIKRLPVQEVKIDKSFVMNMAADDNDAVIVRSTIDLGHNLGLRVVAEGVEDLDSWRRLDELGCDHAQGYLLSRPLPAEELTPLLVAGFYPGGDVAPASSPGKVIQLQPRVG